LLAKKDKLIINTLLNKKNSSSINVNPHSSVSIEIPIHQDINIVFGQKGTGKSEILKSLKNHYDRKSIQCEYYVGTSRDVDFDKLKDISGISRNSETVNAESCESNFRTLITWEDKSPILFRHFFDWYETRDNNSNKKRMRITEATHLIYINDTELNQKEKEMVSIRRIIKELSQIRLDKYIDLDSKNQLLEIIRIFELQVYKNLVSEFIEKESVNLANKSIDIIKQLADACSDTKSRPSTTGIYDFVTNRIKLYKLTRDINDNISDKRSEEKDLIGILDDKGAIYLLTKYQMLNKTSTRGEFKTGIRALRYIKTGLKNVEDTFFASNVKEELMAVVDSCVENSVISTSCFLGISKKVVTEDNQEYNPSKGECGILLLQKQLRKISDVYILDEPELGMGNSYINNTILPQLMNLVESKKTVIIATHNANIAVRTLPYISIYRTHKNGNYQTYVGNPYIDELQNIENDKDVIEWSTESMKTLEGGQEAFYERKIIYESGR
jgi:predicted ATPase